MAAAAKTKWPAEQGLVSMTGTFIDTIIICTMTGLTLIVSGVWCGDVNGAAMTEAAFASAFPGMAKYMLTFGLVLFAFSTIIGWSYYGERCCEYLFGLLSASSALHSGTTRGTSLSIRKALELSIITAPSR